MSHQLNNRFFIQVCDLSRINKIIHLYYYYIEIITILLIKWNVILFKTKQNNFKVN